MRKHFAQNTFLVIALAVALIFSGSDGSSVASAQSSAAGNTYYVSPDGSDTAAGTEGAPFRTIQKAARTLDA